MIKNENILVFIGIECTMVHCTLQVIPVMEFTNFTIISRRNRSRNQELFPNSRRTNANKQDNVYHIPT